MSRPGGLLAVELAAFGFFGFFWGVFAVLLTDLSRALGLPPGPLGFALFVGALASIVTMATLGWTSDRLGRRPFLALSGIGLGVGLTGVAFSESYGFVVGALVVLYSASGLFDVGINAAAVDLEKTSGRRFMAFLHAAFSAGAVVGAITAGVLLAVGVDFRVVYLSVLGPLAATVIWIAATDFPTVTPVHDGRDRPSLHRHPALLLVAAIAFLCFVSEGEMEHWSGVYLRRYLDLPALVGASGVAVFYGAMAVGRLGAAWTVQHLGHRRTLVGAGLMASASMVLALATTRPVVVIAGFLLVGLALAAVAPIAFSVAGDLAPDRAGGAVSVVTTLGYGGFLLGPALVGGLAEVTGLRWALGVIAVAGALVAVLGVRVRAT